MGNFEDRLAQLEADDPDEVLEYEEPFIPPYEQDPDFHAYKREFYRLRYEFFKRAKGPDGDCLDQKACGKGGPLCPNCHAKAKWELQGDTYKHLAEAETDTGVNPEDTVNLRDFTIRVNMRSTMKQMEAEIDRQIKLIKRQIKEAKGTKLIVRDYHHAHRGGKKDTHAYWRRCLDVYDRIQSGESLLHIATESSRTSFKDRRTEAEKRPGGKPEPGVKPPGTIKSEIRDDYAEAERLIKSAASGTFPE